MSGITLYEYRIPLPGVQRTVLYQLNDLHLAVSDEFSSEEDMERVARSVDNWNRGRAAFAEAYGEPFGEAQREPVQRQLQKLLSSLSDADALLLGGDIVDYPSAANTRVLEQEFRSVSVPVLSVCGNHEDPVNDSVQILKFPGFCVVGLDDSRRVITAEQNEKLRGVLADGMPVFLLMHVPIFGAEADGVFARCEPYYRLDHSEMTEETKRFLQIIQEHTEQIKAIFAGHLHFGSVTQVAPSTTQYVCTQAILGAMNRYVIGE